SIEIFNSDRLPLGTAWAYIMALDKIRSYGGILLSGGCWSPSSF
ncbi:MAG: gamma-glutamylcyclotransferase, partial [Okeania sp. SIO2H7]|nr:gamma-glutamylcyclotransferase [Okeania sp. SIO2H7]